VYINGVPYTRRELEMPVAALHHAGVHAAQVCVCMYVCVPTCVCCTREY
jgi:hypothetical protein